MCTRFSYIPFYVSAATQRLRFGLKRVILFGLGNRFKVDIEDRVEKEA